MGTDVLRQNKILKNIQSCLTDAMLNKGMASGAHAGFGEKIGLSWTGNRGPGDHRSQLPWPWLGLRVATMASRRARFLSS